MSSTAQLSAGELLAAGGLVAAGGLLLATLASRGSKGSLLK